MKKITLINLVFVLLFNLTSFENVFAQVGLVEISLQKQIEASSLVVEGKVISKQSFWDSQYKNIYTKNTVEVFKVFKGAPIETIEIITIGGVVDNNALTVTHSLQLSLKDKGVFTLINSNTQLLNEKSNLQKFKAYSGIQGFYKYDIITNSAHNVFKSYNGIENVFYQELKSITKTNLFEFKKKDVSISNNSILEPQVVIITNVLPTAITAGTESVLTISGFGFGTVQGTVSFRDADDGGVSFIDALDSQIVSWNDTQIEVKVPQSAGSGNIRVTHNSDGTFGFSSQILTVSYSILNIETGGNAFISQHYNENGSGGYTWQMFTGFDTNTPANESFIRAFETWVCETGVNWEIGTPIGINANSSDGTNIITFDSVSSQLPVGVLGVSFTYFATTCGTEWVVSELDLVFDNDTNWQFGPANAIAGQFDFESVAVHELGHAHQLGHIIDSGAIMHYSIGPSQNSRALSTNDINGGGFVQNRSTTIQNCTYPLMTDSSCSLSTSEEELNSFINVYPNPNNGEFFIKKTSFINLEKAIVYDISGRLISTHDISDGLNIKTINLESISKGMYFVSIYSENAVVTKKIILE
ncbi:MAG: T9SS type A sorting domain-containing protein [Flavobacteriaceae bacterium]|nr:T9SS type A sorting domain-containing protein [Flavobacteriaceae bacterium]